MGFKDYANNVIPVRSSADTWTNMPSTETEYLGVAVHRVFANLKGLRQSRIQIAVTTAGAAASFLKIQYTVDLTGADGWADLTTSAVLTSTGPAKSTWSLIPAAARTEVLLRIVGDDGDGAADPVINHVSIATKW